MDRADIPAEIDSFLFSSLNPFHSESHMELRTQRQFRESQATAIEHKSSKAEDKAIEIGLSELSKDFFNKVNLATLNPHCLPHREHDNRSLVSVALAPINDGTGDQIFMKLVADDYEISRSGSQGEDLDRFKNETLRSALKASFRNPLVSAYTPVHLKFIPTYVNQHGPAKLYSPNIWLGVTRMDQQGEDPPGFAFKIQGAVAKLLKTQGRDNVSLEAMHDVAVRMTKESEPFNNMVKESLGALHENGAIPKTEILEGSTIRVVIPGPDNVPAAEIIASPNKATEYIEFKPKDSI